MMSGDSGLKSFLIKRGISEENINMLIEDKIDASVLPLMPDSDLKRYLPCYGDRLAAVAFCKVNTAKEESAGEGTSVLQRLNMRKQRKERKDTLTGGCAKLTHRRIELGWMHLDKSTDTYKQVRSQNGGGTRSLSLDKSFKKIDIVAKGKILFFPDGVSKKGNLTDMEVDLRDFGMSHIGDQTISEMYEKYQVKLLRLYLCTRETKDTEEDTSECHTGMEDCRMQVESADPTTPTVPFPVPSVPVSSVPVPSAPVPPVPVPSVSVPSVPVPSVPVPSAPVPSAPVPSVPVPSVPVPSAQERDSGTPTVVFNRIVRHQGVDNTLETLPDLDGLDDTASTTEELSIDVDMPSIRASVRGAGRRLSLTLPNPSAGEESRVSSLEDVLTTLQENVVFGPKNILNVDREDVLPGALIGFKRQRFDQWRQIDVKFSGERSIDGGGPSREFMRLCLYSIQHSSIFEGGYTERDLALDYCALSDKKYEVFGKMIAYIVVHGGPLPSFLCESLYRQLTTGFESSQPKLEDIYDCDLRHKVTQLLRASDNTAFQMATDNLQELIHLSGTVRLSLCFHRKEELVSALVNCIVIERKRKPFEQFVKGLECCGLLAYIQKYPIICQRIFLHNPQVLDANVVDNLFQVQWSTFGSNRYRKELKTQTFFRNWLQECEDNNALKQLLIFVTGLDDIPPLGFCPQPTLDFSQPDDYEADDPRAGFPIANTCSMKLTLPILSDYQQFAMVMTNCINILTVFTNE